MAEEPATSPIYRLNEDTLIELFKIVAWDDPPGYLHPYPSRVWHLSRLHLGWTRVSHVCHLWRRVIIYGLPSLWAQVVLVFPREEAYTTMLSRAQDLPIVLSVHRSIEQSALRAATFAFVRAHCGRARLLDFPVLNPPEDWSDLFNSDVLPHLRELRLRELTHLGDLGLSELNIRAPSLLTAVIGKLRYPIVALHAAQLVHLDVVHCEMFTLQHLYDTLSKTPSLEFLRATTLPALWVDDLPTPDECHLDLPRLRRVHLLGRQSNFLPLLRALSPVAHIQQVELDRFIDVEREELHEALNVLRPADLVEGCSLNSLYIHHGRFQTCAFDMQEYDRDRHSTFEPPKRALWFSVSLLSETRAEQARLLPRFCATLRLSDIEHLVIQRGIPDNPDLWANLSSVSSITFMMVATVEEPKVARALALLGEASARDSALLFPHLHTLTLCDCEYCDPFDKIDAKCLQGWWEHIIDGLTIRRNNGVPIRKLVICTLYGTTNDPRIEIDDEGMKRASALVEDLVDQRRLDK
ncbi:unnamed protein product [Peniophora sp. CBMAI 1063]|nr:unnamed protein product [Peniophora sp. CBMAI 1063]